MLHRGRNARLPFNRMPQEVITRIFAYYMDDCMEEDSPRLPSAVRYLVARDTLAFVSTYWRTIVQSTPEFWALVTRVKPLDLLAKDISRAKSTLLNVITELKGVNDDFKKPSADERFWSLIRLDSCRSVTALIRSGNLSWESESLVRLDLLGFRLGVDAEEEDLRLPEASQLPRLTVLRLAHLGLAHPQLPKYSLTELALSYVRNCAVDGVLGVLENSPNLQVLYIDGWSPEAVGDKARRLGHRPNRLKRLTLDNVPGDALRLFLGAIELETLEYLRMTSMYPLHSGDLPDHLCRSAQRLLFSKTSGIARATRGNVTSRSCRLYQLAWEEMEMLIPRLCGDVAELDVRVGSGLHQWQMLDKVGQMDPRQRIRRISVPCYLFGPLLSWMLSMEDGEWRGSHVESLVVEDIWAAPMTPDSDDNDDDEWLEQGVNSWLERDNAKAPTLRTLLCGDRDHFWLADNALKHLSPELVGRARVKRCKGTGVPNTRARRENSLLVVELT